MQPQTIKDFLQKNCFSYCFYAFLLLGIFPLVLCSKHHINMEVNDHVACYALDPFFIYYSQLFEGWAIIFVVIAMIFVSRRKMLLILIASVLCGLGIMFLKEFVIGNVPRPTKLLPLSSFPHLLENLDIYKKNYSFPSGHTTFAFAIMALFSSFSNSKTIAVTLFLVAIGAAFSRIYLLQHFFIDIYVGAILGFFISLFTMFLCDKVLKVPEDSLLRIRR